MKFGRKIPILASDITTGCNSFSVNIFLPNDNPPPGYKVHFANNHKKSFNLSLLITDFKLNLFNGLLDNRDDFVDIKERKLELDVGKVLKQTDSVDLITKYFAENNPRFYQLIAQNPNMPIDLLIELKDIKDIKFSRNIRNYAIENIRNRKKNALKS